MNSDIQRARDALHAIPPDIPRDDWHRVGRAAIACGLSIDEIDQWSAPASNYRGRRDVESAFRTITPDGKTGPGTLFHIASEHGWRNGAAVSFSAPIPPPKSASAINPLDVWNRCEPATAVQPYIVSKQGAPDGLRVVPAGDRLRIAGESMAGALVVPIACNGKLSSLQFITPTKTAERLKARGKKSKLNLPGCRMDGWHVVGQLAPGGTAYICEGIGQAWACNKATGCAAVVAFGWGRVRAVAESLRQRDTSARLVVVPDVGKEADAETIARSVGATFVQMPDGWPNNSDVNDLMQRDGIEAVAAVLASAREPVKPEPRFKLLSTDDLRALPPLQWRVRGVLPATGLAAIYGPSASGKSFLGFDLAAHVAEGRRWFGCRVESAPVVYCALEGEAGFKLRAAAWEDFQGHKLPAGLQMILQSFDVTEPQDVQDLAAVVPTGAVVIIDTLNRAAPGCDENSSVDMGLIIEAAKCLQRLTGGLVVLVHHSGKDSAKGLRGHSSLFAALDAVLEVSRNGDSREWRIAKSKDDADGIARPFKLEVVPLGFDGYGDAVTSCVIAPDTAAAEMRRVIPPKSGNQKVLWDGLCEMLACAEICRPADAPESLPPDTPAVRLEMAIDTLRERLACDAKRKTERTQQGLTGLQSKGLIRIDGGYVWLV